MKHEPCSPAISLADSQPADVDQEPRCPACGDSLAIAFAFQRDGNFIYECKNCGAEFLSPQPSDETLSSIYSSTYFLGSRDEDSPRRQEALKRQTANLYLDILSSFIPAKNATLLEVGCGRGAFLIEAERRGFQVEGLEYSEDAAAEANSRLGKTAVRVGSVESKSLDTAAYDVIGAFDVIEHLRDPRATLVQVRRALKPGGLLVIATPSLDSWSRRLLGRYWMEYKTEHLTYFNRRSLTFLLESVGFRLVRVLPNKKVVNFDYVAGHFDRYRVPLVSPLLHLIRRSVPAKLAYRPIQIVPSGIMALATKVQ